MVSFLMPLAHQLAVKSGISFHLHCAAKELCTARVLPCATFTFRGGELVLTKISKNCERNEQEFLNSRPLKQTSNSGIMHKTLYRRKCDELARQLERRVKESTHTWA
ncbi:hypothetical protein ABBQ38_013020 [Trebouxia sp. C0009 RCD-2024]